MSRPVVVLHFLLSIVLFQLSPAVGAATARVLYETRFEAAEGFDPALTLVGQSGWVGQGSGGNGLVTDFFPNEGQHAFVGFGAPTNNGDFLNAWRPVNYTPGPTNPPVVRFSVLMSVEDSATTTNRDDFRWSVYNSGGDRLFTLDFDNVGLGINYLLDDNSFVPTGRTFTNATPYRLELIIELTKNIWSASLDGAFVVTNLPVTTRNSSRDFGDVDAVWAVRRPGSPGDNYMVFDNYRVVAEGTSTNTPPRLEALDRQAPGKFLVRCFGTPGLRYALEATPDFGAWLSLKTNTVPVDGYFDHLDASGAGLRFYRLVEL